MHMSHGHLKPSASQANLICWLGAYQSCSWVPSTQPGKWHKPGRMLENELYPPPPTLTSGVKGTLLLLARSGLPLGSLLN